MIYKSRFVLKIKVSAFRTKKTNTAYPTEPLAKRENGRLHKTLSANIENSGEQYYGVTLCFDVFSFVLFCRAWPP